IFVGPGAHREYDLPGCIDPDHTPATDARFDLPVVLPQPQNLPSLGEPTASIRQGGIMFDLFSHRFRCCDGLNRRSFLKVGALALGGLALPELLRQQAHGAASGKKTAVIQLVLAGGPTHHETFDPKPDAPAEYRGPFGAIPTSVAGIQVCELFPKL